MFHFTKETLDPAMAPLLRKLRAVMKLESVTDRTEQMLALREQVHGVIARMAEDESTKGLFISIGLMVTSAYILGGIGVAPAAASLIGAMLGGGAAFKYFLNTEAIHGKRALAARIDKEVERLAEAHPRAVMKSARYQQNIRHLFGTARGRHPARRRAAQPGNTSRPS